MDEFIPMISTRELRDLRVVADLPGQIDLLCECFPCSAVQVSAGVR